MISITAFEDEKCEIPYLIIEREFKIELHQLDLINLVTEKISYTSLSDEVSSALNLSNYCGLKIWKTKQPIDVTGLKCDNYRQLSKNQKYFQQLKLNSESAQLGLESETKDGRTEESRPNIFDPLLYLKM